MTKRKKRLLKDWAVVCVLSLCVLETVNPCVNVVVAGMHASHPVYPVSPLVGVFELFMAMSLFALGALSIVLRPDEWLSDVAAKRPLYGREPGADRSNVRVTGIATPPAQDGQEKS